MLVFPHASEVHRKLKLLIVYSEAGDISAGGLIAL